MYQLLERAANGNYFPHGEFQTYDEANDHAKSIGLPTFLYTVRPTRKPTTH